MRSRQVQGSLITVVATERGVWSVWGMMLERVSNRSGGHSRLPGTRGAQSQHEPVGARLPVRGGHVSAPVASVPQLEQSPASAATLEPPLAMLCISVAPRR